MYQEATPDKLTAIKGKARISRPSLCPNGRRYAGFLKHKQGKHIEIPISWALVTVELRHFFLHPPQLPAQGSSRPQLTSQGSSRPQLTSQGSSWPQTGSLQPLSQLLFFLPQPRKRSNSGVLRHFLAECAQESQPVSQSKLGPGSLDVSQQVAVSQPPL